MPLDPNAVHIHTDGSCYGNPGGSGGAAAMVTFPDHLNIPSEQIFDFGCAETSNNRMELRACIGALEWIRRNRPWPGVDRVQLISDSMYVIDNLHRAIGWKKNDWRNLHGEPKENADLWKSLLSAYAKVGMRVHFTWRAGKTSPTLKHVDKVAKAAAKRGSIGLDRGYKRGKVARSKVKGPATIFQAQGQVAVIRPYRKTAPSKGENRIRFDLFVEHSGEYVASHYAYTTDSLTAELHRQHLYRVKFNNNAHNPRIEEIMEEIRPPKTS